LIQSCLLQGERAPAIDSPSLHIGAAQGAVKCSLAAQTHTRTVKKMLNQREISHSTRTEKKKKNVMASILLQGRIHLTSDVLVEAVSVALHFTEGLALATNSAFLFAGVEAGAVRISGSFRKLNCSNKNKAQDQQCSNFVCHFPRSS
jgi:hypothetical protein